MNNYYNMNYLKENTYSFYCNKIYPNFYHQIEGTKKFLYNVIKTTKDYYNNFYNIKYNLIEMNRIEEYRRLTYELPLYNKPVQIYGDIKND